MILKFHMDQIRGMPRPAGYAAELSACATSREGVILVFDDQSPCWQALKKKYEGWNRPRCCNCRGGGIGDALEELFVVTGIARLAHLWAKLTRQPCGCAARRDKMNGRFAGLWEWAMEWKSIAN